MDGVGWIPWAWLARLSLAFCCSIYQLYQYIELEHTLVTHTLSFFFSYQLFFKYIRPAAPRIALHNKRCRPSNLPRSSTEQVRSSTLPPPPTLALLSSK